MNEKTKAILLEEGLEGIATDMVRVENVYRDWETDRKSTRLNSSHRL